MDRQGQKRKTDVRMASLTIGTGSLGIIIIMITKALPKLTNALLLVLALFCKYIGG